MAKNSEFRPQKFAVVGAGPVGCIVAAFLAKDGYDVTLCDVIEELIKPAKDPGIRIEGAETLLQPIPKTCTHIDALADDPPDVMISPRLGHIGLFEFHRGREAIPVGEDAAHKELDEIEHCIMSLA